ncbi:MAG: DNA topoisomerase, partial [Fusobacteriaceae bacterium]
SLDVIQNLYEKGYITYPRTNTEYLAENEKDKVKEIIKTFSEYNLAFKDTKKIFDDSKIESHSAIIPTTKRPTNLFGHDEAIYKTILNRFISNFLDEETITEKVTMTINVGEEEFKLNGESIKSEGFYKYEPERFENQLPQLSKGEEFSVNFIAMEKETSPPKKATEEDLANFLKNPFKKDGDSEDEEYKAILQGIEIGTEATRTGIVENAKRYGYISQKGSIFSIEPLGEKLIEILDKLQINMYKEKSVEFSKLQKKVYKGEAKINDLTSLTEKELTTVISSNIKIERFESEYNGVVAEDKREIIAKCPKCGKNIYESIKSFYCDGFRDEPKCNFTIWKTSKIIPSISKELAIQLIKGEKVLFKDLKSSKGNIFSAFFLLKEEGQYWNLKLDSFENTSKEKKVEEGEKRESSK